MLNATGACVCCLQFFRCDSTCLGYVKEKGASSVCQGFRWQKRVGGAIVALGSPFAPRGRCRLLPSLSDE